MKVVKVITTDANGELTRELTIHCQDNAAEAKLFHTLVTTVVKLSSDWPEIQMQAGVPMAKAALYNFSDITEEDEVPVDGA
jgi:hypothetical protein